MTNSISSIFEIEISQLYYENFKYKLTLHHHGTLRLLSLSFNKKFKKLDKSIKLQNLKESDHYQEVMFNHYSSFMGGYHGPFMIKNISSGNFIGISMEVFLKNFYDILLSPKANTPMINRNTLNKVKKLISSLRAEDSFIFYLNKCEIFNINMNPHNYEHEWSHAINQFHEFVFFHDKTSEVFCLYLIYE